MKMRIMNAGRSLL